MAIKLRVISEQYRELGEHGSRVFGVNGGSVGRAPDNDWVLPDPRRVVSGHHFEVLYHGGKYWLNDTSTNGVYVNEAEEPASATGRVELRDGDRLRMGDYEILVSVDKRIDFLPAASEEHSAAKHLDAGIGHSLDLDSLLTPRDTAESGSISMRNAFGVKVTSDARAALLEALQRSVNEARETPPAHADGSSDSVIPPMGPREDRGVAPQQNAASAAAAAAPAGAAATGQPVVQDWALRTRRITREELADAMARRQSRVDASRQAIPLYQQASTWTDLRSAVQAFCRGAGIDPASLSAEAQAMLPLVAGQLLREAIVGLNDISQARAAGAIGARAAASTPAPATGSSNPLRTSTSVEQAIQRLFESHGRLYGGPVESLRDVLQEAKDHEAGLEAATRAGLHAVLEQLSPANVADQFEQGRARMLPPGQDPRPRYWEHYADFYRLFTQQANGELPHPFVEAFSQEYARVRADLRQKRAN
jgi:type VI secretion system protein